MTGTSSALTWSIRAATSFGVGSSKFAGWMAPDDGPAVGLGEVGVGVVVGQQLALVRRGWSPGRRAARRTARWPGPRTRRSWRRSSARRGVGRGERVPDDRGVLEWRRSGRSTGAGSACRPPSGRRSRRCSRSRAAPGCRSRPAVRRRACSPRRGPLVGSSSCEPVDEDQVGLGQHRGRARRRARRCASWCPPAPAPSTSRRLPATAATIEVIGATVVTTRRPPRSGAASDTPAHPASVTTRQAAAIPVTRPMRPPYAKT